MKQNIKNRLTALFESHFGEEVTYFEMLPASGSYREYCRIKSERFQAIGAFNADLKENTAFLEFSKHFSKKQLNVPEIYAVGAPHDIYLQSDLGDTTLFSFITSEREKGDFGESIVEVYKKVLQQLPKLQVKGAEDLDWCYCYPRSAFDRQSMMWDLNYFKYYFLKLAQIPFDEQDLENDYNTFIDFLLQENQDYFLYRDFQSRNIMLNNDEICFIDYQGGRKGALQYDLASLLFDAKADIPNEVRAELLEYYLDQLETIIEVDRDKFKSFYYGYVLIRIMQAMGAYGFRGFYEKKEHFLKSIPYALNNMQWLLDNTELPIQVPELIKVLQKVAQSEYLREIGTPDQGLTVKIMSFSFKKGYPVDPSGNGGGFVFDCRSIHNPGRYEPYKQLTGMDEPVKKFLEEKSEMEEFLSPVYRLVDESVKKYLERKFNHLCVSFGCTGGQHRSVYAAERLARYLKDNYPVKVVLNHREQER
ncbi:phosphotransferase enzyme family protein [Prolixibacteraceae bacterium JC049]|nr:phosphotransferase enzyme family protein [Prolixibacteraceae bacterium JC049]